MYLKQSDLLWGLDNSFVKEFINAGMKKTHPQGFQLFNVGDPADYFFIMIKGRIKLSLDEPSKTAYIVEHAGEAFGWSGLVGMAHYSAAAECLEESIVMTFAKDFVREVTDADPENGMRFYRKLARMLGKRLIHSYYLDADMESEIPYTRTDVKKIEPHPE
jgi:CRP-like cAMP-binding protein